MRKAYPVMLEPGDRTLLHGLLIKGAAATRTLTHARILLKADQGLEGPAWSDGRIATALDVSRSTVGRVRKRFAEEGLEGGLTRRQQNTMPARKLDGRQEAHLVALACSVPPAGRSCWTLRLLADRFVELVEAEVDTISHETVRRVLKKTHSSHGRRSSGAFHRRRTPTSSGTWRMCSTCTLVPLTRADRRSVSTRSASSC